MWCKRFCLLMMRWNMKNGMKFIEDWQAELKKSSELYRKILLLVLSKVGLNFVHFALMKGSKMKPRTNFGSKSPFFYQASKLRKYCQKFMVRIAKFMEIIISVTSFLKIYLILWDAFIPFQGGKKLVGPGKVFIA